MLVVETNPRPSWHGSCPDPLHLPVPGGARCPGSISQKRCQLTTAAARLPHIGHDVTFLPESRGEVIESWGSLPSPTAPLQSRPGQEVLWDFPTTSGPVRISPTALSSLLSLSLHLCCWEKEGLCPHEVGFALAPTRGALIMSHSGCCEPSPAPLIRPTYRQPRVSRGTRFTLGEEEGYD